MFGCQVITSEGAALLRKAAADSEKIVFTRAKAGSERENSRGDLCAKPLAWYGVKNGSISAVSNALGFLQVSASFSATDSGTDPIKSVCICAQIAKDDVEPEYAEADDIIVAAVSNDNAGFISGDAFSVEFDLPVVAGSVVDAVGSIPNASGLSVLSFTAGEAPADGVLQIKLADGKIIDIAANEHSA